MNVLFSIVTNILKLVNTLSTVVSRASSAALRSAAKTFVTTGDSKAALSAAWKSAKKTAKSTMTRSKKLVNQILNPSKATTAAENVKNMANLASKISKTTKTQEEKSVDLKSQKANKNTLNKQANQESALTYLNTLDDYEFEGLKTDEIKENTLFWRINSHLREPGTSFEESILDAYNAENFEDVIKMIEEASGRSLLADSYMIDNDNYTAREISDVIATYIEAVQSVISNTYKDYTPADTVNAFGSNSVSWDDVR